MGHGNGATGQKQAVLELPAALERQWVGGVFLAASAGTAQPPTGDSEVFFLSVMDSFPASA